MRNNGIGLVYGKTGGVEMSDAIRSGLCVYEDDRKMWRLVVYLDVRLP